MRKFLSVLFLSCVFLPAFCQNNFQSLDSALTVLSKTHRFNGTVLYAEKGKVLYKKAFGISDIRRGSPLNIQSAFNLASVTKQFIAMSVLQLVEKGKLGLDEEMKKYLPELSYPGITIRNLLNHTSGLPEYFDVFNLYKEAFDTLTNDQLIKLFAVHQPKSAFAPGTKWKYCNTNYALLVSIIERVSGSKMENYLKENIFTPLGLKNTYLYSVKMPVTPVNHVYGFTEKNGKRIINDLTDADGVVGDGNMYSSVEDLFAWEQSLYTEKLVKQGTLNHAFEPAILANGDTTAYGFGWFIEKSKPGFFWHTGGWAGFRNLIYRDTKRNRTLVILSNGDNGLGLQSAKKFFEGLKQDIPAGFLLKNILLIDGTGSAGIQSDLRVSGKRITDIGNLEPYEGEQVIDGGGKILAPGFVDSHSHLLGSLREQPGALAALNQGVTTIVSGQDGEHDAIDSIKKWIQDVPVSINLATFTGQTTLREAAMGPKKLLGPCTAAELEKMKSLLRDEMQKGSLGLSTGLEYEGAFYSTRNEVIELAKVAAAEQGKYISHIRSEDITMDDAVDEIINIGREAKIPVQLTHIKIALKDNWGTAPQLLAKLQRARAEGIDITADVYPYDFWNSTIRVLFPKKNFTELAGAEFAVDHLFNADSSVLVRYLPDAQYQGKTIGAIAGMRHESAAKTLLFLIASAEKYEKDHPEAGGAETIMGKAMEENDVAAFISWPHANICSDGGNGGHPRGYGTFTRVLNTYVKEKHLLTWEDAIHKMTALSAEHVGIVNRGVLAPGYFADMVLIDPATIKDHAAVGDSRALSDGILCVWVNGVAVYRDKKLTGKFPGEFIPR